MYMAKCAHAPTLCQCIKLYVDDLLIFVSHKRMSWKHVNHLKFLFCIRNNKNICDGPSLPTAIHFDAKKTMNIFLLKRHSLFEIVFLKINRTLSLRKCTNNKKKTFRNYKFIHYSHINVTTCNENRSLLLCFTCTVFISDKNANKSFVMKMEKMNKNHTNELI